jgi:tRNA threonylcarbamoyl adenosine modification protein YjeE
MTILSQSKTKTAQQTKKIGSQWAHHIEQKEKNKQRTGATIITLSGDLGSGKTTFTQGFLSYFGIEPQAASPTFTIIKHWKINRSSWVTDIYHADFYRLDNVDEMKGIGWYEAIDNVDAIIIVEWPERVPGVVESAAYKLSLAHTNNPTERVIREM